MEGRSSVFDVGVFVVGFFRVLLFGLSYDCWMVIVLIEWVICGDVMFLEWDLWMG